MCHYFVIYIQKKTDKLSIFADVAYKPAVY